MAPGAPVVIHTGYWGAGVFGGNRVLMAMLQLLAASMAEVTRVVFHAIGPEADGPFEEARRIVLEELGPLGELTSADLIDRITAMGFKWGMSDGR
jgi:hypothetical protein